MQLDEPSLLTGELPARLANEVSDAIHRALQSGMEADEAACVAAAVAADYARRAYGDEYLPALASVVARRAEKPLASAAPPAPVVREADRTLEIIGAIYKVVERLGGRSDILSLVGSWRDTLSDADVLQHLNDWLDVTSPPTPVTIPDEQRLADDILAELVRARTKFPGKNVTFAALVEEVGELATATFEESREKVRKEAIQVAVMAMRMVLDGDHTFDDWRAGKGLDPLLPAVLREERDDR